MQMNVPNDPSNPGVWFIPVLLQVGLAVYVYWCVRRGFVWLRLERVERKKNPRKFRIILVSYIVVDALLGAFTLYNIFKS